MENSITEWRNEIGRFQNITCTTYQCSRASTRSVDICSNCIAAINRVGESKISKLINLLENAP